VARAPHREDVSYEVDEEKVWVMVGAYDLYVFKEYISL